VAHFPDIRSRRGRTLLRPCTDSPKSYSYTAPEPTGLPDEPLQPSAARWIERNGSHIALLRYDDARTLPEPRAAVLDFFKAPTKPAPATPDGTSPAGRAPAASPTHRSSPSRAQHRKADSRQTPDRVALAEVPTPPVWFPHRLCSSRADQQPALAHPVQPGQRQADRRARQGTGGHLLRLPRSPTRQLRFCRAWDTTLAQNEQRRPGR
jgi:hypothetical protein